MKTTKCKIANEVNIAEYVCKYNTVLRIAYNCFKDGISQSSIKRL